MFGKFQGNSWKILEIFDFGKFWFFGKMENLDHLILLTTINNTTYFEGVCGRATNVILAPSAGCEGFARRSVKSVPARKLAQTRAKSRKVAQIIQVPGSSLTIICCAGISCVGCRKLAYSYGSFMPRELKIVPMGTRDWALRVAKK